MAIKLGVSSYSYQDEYYLGKMTLEDCIAHLSGIGGEGFELIPEQMLPGDNFMRLSDEFVDQWFGWMDKYKIKPTCLDHFDDYNMFENRTLTVREQLDLTENFFQIGKRLGFFVVRVNCTTPFEVLEKMIPMGEYYGLILGLEIHSPLSMKSEWAYKWRNLIERTGTKYAGFIPDFGIFSKRPYTVAVEKAIRQGANPKILDYIIEEYSKEIKERLTSTEVYKQDEFVLEEPEFKKRIAAEVRKMGGGPLEVSIALGRYTYDDPKWLIEVMPLIIHTHAKFYDMREDYVEPNIDNENVIAVLKENGYDGYISSEYEGHGYFRDLNCNVIPDGPEQVRRHHVMMRRLLE